MLLQLLLAALVSVASAPASAQEDALEVALARAGEQAALWEAALADAPEAARPGFRFVLANMPARDLAALDPARVADQIALGYEVRARVPWAAALDDELYFNDVLAPSHLNEVRDLMRRELADGFLPRVAALESSGEAALFLNATLFGELGVRYSTARRRADQGPRESIETGLASCTGLSILLAEACRACGIPARVAGIHSWPNKRGNHTWVEVFDTRDSAWHHLGAAEPDGRGLDHAWFGGDAAQAVPGSATNGIWAASYRRTEHLFPLVWLPEQDYVHAVEVTQRYLPAEKRDTVARVHVSVRGVGGARVAVPVNARAVPSTNGDAEEEAQSGTSRDEEADTNDFLTFELAPGHAWVIAVPGGPSTTVAAKAGDARVELVLGPDDDTIAGWLAADPALARRKLWEAYAVSPEHAALRRDFEAGLVRTHDRTSPWVARTVGERPEGGWPLVIAMHGGGGVPKEVNDSQWRHMQVYYRDHPEVSGYRYLALRAPNDAWNGFYDAAIAPLIEELVLQQVLCAGVDANRVHVIGYSHGGYGAWVIAPKIPDRFAAAHASAAAASGGETQLANLFALPFSFMCGEADSAYGRIERNRHADEELATLRGERTDGWYPARFQFVADQGHGGLPDRDKLVELLPLVRDPLPREVVWRPSDNRIRDHYWLSIDHPAGGQAVHAVLEDGAVTLECAGVPELVLWLDERLVGERAELEVRHGEALETRALVPSVAAMRASLRRWRDPERIYATKLVVNLGG